MTQKKSLSGIWCPVLTPVDANLTIDTTLLCRQIKLLLEEGCHGVVLFGTTGEAPSFSVSERQQALEAVLQQDIAPDRIIVGVGCAALTDTEALLRHSLANHCKQLLMLPPFYFKNLSDDAVYDSFATVFDRCGEDRMSVLLYNFPSLSAVPLTISMTRRLRSDYGPIVAGIKDSSGDWDNTRAMIEELPELSIFPGSERLLLPALKAGGAGCISATANANSMEMRQTYDAFERGVEGIEERQERLNSIRSIFEQFAFAPALKTWLASTQSESRWLNLRPPLLKLSEKQSEQLFIDLQKVGFGMV